MPYFNRLTFYYQDKCTQQNIITHSHLVNTPKYRPINNFLTVLDIICQSPLPKSVLTIAMHQNIIAKNLKHFQGHPGPKKTNLKPESTRAVLGG